ncbi:acyl carrier protein [Streptosporangium violaceochromogenes]|nr:acyl carrier protein [Streptosporangium violaceochromogenes]
MIQEVSGVPAAEVTSEKSIVDDLDVDSLSMVEIGIALEDRLGVQIAEDRLREISTINDLVDHIDHSLNGR